LLFYAINLDVVSLFADSSFTFLTMLNDILYKFKLMNIILVFGMNDILIY